MVACENLKEKKSNTGEGGGRGEGNQKRRHATGERERDTRKYGQKKPHLCIPTEMCEGVRGCR